MNTMTYEGYTARVDFDDVEGIFSGRLLGISDVVGFHADNVPELRAALKDAVDDYAEACARIGKQPEKPASGKLMLRIPPDVHRAALVAAESAGTSLNQWASKVLRQAAHT